MNAQISQLESMGFSRTSAETALKRVNGDLERAIAILLQGPPPSPPPSQATTVDLTMGDKDDDLRRAIELSKEQDQKEKKERGDRQKKLRFASLRSPSSQATRAASNTKAAEAALGRLTHNPTKADKHRGVESHPKVRMPKTLKEKSFKEQVMRTVFRVSPSSLAVDTLIKTLETIKNNSTNPKYRTIDMGTRGFKKALDGVPGVTDLLELGVGFKRNPSNRNIFRLDFVDEARFYAVLSALKDLGNVSHAYNLSRLRRVWEVRMENLMKDDTTGEITKRGEYLRLSPSEPGIAACSIVTVNVNSNTKISRRFAADDTVKDVLHWISGSVSSKVYDLVVSDEVVLINLSKGNPKCTIKGDEAFRAL